MLIGVDPLNTEFGYNHAKVFLKEWFMNSEIRELIEKYEGLYAVRQPKIEAFNRGERLCLLSVRRTV